MLVWVTLLSGVVVCLLGSLAIVRADRDWRRGPQRCRRCQQIRYGRDELCDDCSAGERPDEARGLPAPDRGVHSDTDPLPVTEPGATPSAQDRLVDYADRVWAAPSVPWRDEASGGPARR